MVSEQQKPRRAMSLGEAVKVLIFSCVLLMHSMEALVSSKAKTNLKTAELWCLKPGKIDALHVKCRNGPYLGDVKLTRTPVPDDKVSWTVVWKKYSPLNYTLPKVFTAPWADPNIVGDSTIKPKFNTVDNGVDRTSFICKYKLNSQGLPMNPRGRTGLEARGALGRWGPNHAADPVVTRWKRDSKGKKVMSKIDGKPILQFASIQRRDTKEWAIPGGMVDAGEHFSAALKREFQEEALDSNNMTQDQLKKTTQMINQMFSNGVTLYSGYVDDPRNTDNAWMETVAVHFHDDSGKGIGMVPLTAGDDAQAVRWTDASSQLPLYASHSQFLSLACERVKASW